MRQYNMSTVAVPMKKQERAKKYYYSAVTSTENLGLRLFLHVMGGMPSARHWTIRRQY